MNMVSSYCIIKHGDILGVTREYLLKFGELLPKHHDFNQGLQALEHKVVTLLVCEPSVYTLEHEN